MFKRGESNRQLLDLNEITRDVLDFTRSDILTRHVQVTTKFAPDLPPVRGDSVQVQQVLLNLIVNGCEAMIGNEPNDRALMIETSVVDHETVGVSCSTTAAASGPTSSISSSSRSSPPSIRAWAGLTICRSIATAHGGQLWPATTRIADRPFGCSCRATTASPW